MRKVVFTGCSDVQVSYGGHHDPRPHLEIGGVYSLIREDIDSWSTDYYLEGFEQYGFNSVCFEFVKNGEG